MGDTRDSGVNGTCPRTTRFQVIFRSQKRMSQRLETLGRASADLAGASSLALRGQLHSEWLGGVLVEHLCMESSSILKTDGIALCVNDEE